MGNFIRKITCPSPLHEDLNPSAALYEDGTAYCFGCSLAFDSGQVGLEVQKVTPAVKENLDEKLRYISTLPRDQIRGLNLPFDNTGYYIVWPGSDYYKCRRFLHTDNSTKYLNPRGYSQPLLVLNSNSKSSTLYIVEGELNALSLGTVCNDLIISPGGVGQFKSTVLKNYLQRLKPGLTIILICDRDAAGLDALLNTSQILRGYSGPVIKHLVEKDLNQVLVDHGKERLKEISEGMGLPTGL